MKAHSDIIVTSSSVEKILSQLPADQKILFAPDKNMGAYFNRKLGRDMLLWPGACIVHEAFSETELLKLKALHPGAPVAAHPECPAFILDYADLVGSTRAILEFALASPSDTIIVATEPHIIHQMEKAAPHKTFIGAPGADGNSQLQHVPVHGAEYAGEALRGAAGSLPPYRAGRGNPSRRQEAAGSHVRHGGGHGWPRRSRAGDGEGMIAGFDVAAFVAATLAEDLGEAGDITSAAVIPADARFTGVMDSRDAITTPSCRWPRQPFARSISMSA